MRRVCFALLACLLWATGCSGDPTPDEGAAREVEPLEASPSGDDATADDGPLTLRLAVPAEWSLDPADAGAASITNRVLADLLYEGLSRLDADGQPVPALVERWFVSDDRLTWTFVLPETTAFNDGAALTARDVKASLERIAARGPADQAATALTAVTGWTDLMSGAAGGAAGITAPDDTTLVVQLDSPFELLLDVLASPAFGVTAETGDGLRTSGAYRVGDDSFVLDAVDADAAVPHVALVEYGDGPTAAVTDGEADWAVLTSDEAASGLGADVVRQPLELELAIVARSPEEAERIGLLTSLEPLLLANAVDGLVARPTASIPGEGTMPDSVTVDVPAGVLGELGDSVVAQLEDAGINAVTVASDADEFADKVASGDALVFPIVLAGGTGVAGSVLRVAAPGASDDVFGPESDTRAELAAAIVSELDLEQRALFIEALERALIEEALLLPIGQFEVRVALSHRLDGLRHRDDGTLDLSDVTLGDQ